MYNKSYRERKRINFKHTLNTMVQMQQELHTLRQTNTRLLSQLSKKHQYDDNTQERFVKRYKKYCFYCNEAGHLKQNCPVAKHARFVPHVRFCSKCNMNGHTEKNCWSIHKVDVKQSQDTLNKVQPIVKFNYDSLNVLDIDQKTKDDFAKWQQLQYDKKKSSVPLEKKTLSSKAEMKTFETNVSTFTKKPFSPLFDTESDDTDSDDDFLKPPIYSDDVAELQKSADSGGEIAQTHNEAGF